MQSKPPRPSPADTTTLYASLSATARARPDKTALIEDEAETTYARLLRRVDRLAAFLRAHGVGPGDRVAVMLLNSVDFCAAFYAVQKLGAACVMINTKWQAPEIRHALETTGATTMILNARWLDKLRDVLPFVPLRQLLLDAVPEGLDAGLPVFPLSAADAETFPPDNGDEANPETIGVVMFTSGTTGKPKGAMLSHRNMMHSILSYAELLNPDSDETAVLPIPAFHITGLICVLGLFIHIGGTTVLRPVFDPLDTLKAMERHRATHFHAVPTVFIALTKALETFPGDVTPLRTALCGGGFITDAAIRALKKRLPNLEFRPVYGLTETSGAGVGFPCDYLALDKKTSAGIALPVAEVFTADASGNRLPIGETGEICMRGPSVVRGYYGMDDLPGGVLRTGDVGTIDADGFIYILDRIKDAINRGGEKIFSLEVENALMEMPAVRQAAVFALPDPYYGETVAAAIVARDGFPVTADRVRDFLSTRLAKFKIPESLFFLDALPVNASNKVLKSRLREQFGTPVTLKDAEASHFVTQ